MKGQLLFHNAYVLFDIFSLAPAVLRQATYGTIKIGVYHTLKRVVNKDAKGKHNTMNKVFPLWLYGDLTKNVDNDITGYF